MKCKRCGTILRSDDEFCFHCGERTTLMQRMVASRMLVGSLLAIIFVAAAAVAAYLILTDRITLPNFADLFSSVSESNGENGGSGNGSPDDGNDGDENGGQPEPEPTATRIPKPTATPYVFRPGNVTAEVKSAVKPLIKRVKPFLAFSASFYADGSHPYKWDDTSATVLALYKLHYDEKKVKYGDSLDSIKKKVKKEMKDLYGKEYKFNLTYSGYFPDYVYVVSGDTVVYNAVQINGKTYFSELKKIIEYKEGKYRVILEACLVNQYTKQKGAIQKYTLFLTDDEDARYGYRINKIRLFQPDDAVVKKTGKKKR